MIVLHDPLNIDEVLKRDLDQRPVNRDVRLRVQFEHQTIKLILLRGSLPQFQNRLQVVVEVERGHEFALLYLVPGSAVHLFGEAQVRRKVGQADYHEPNLVSVVVLN